jgi:quinol monooxygenase YgiN
VYILIANVYSKKDKAEQLKEAGKELGRATSREPGCVHWTMHRRQDDPTTFVFYEIYRDEAAFKTHMESAHSKRFLDAFNGQKLGRADIEVTLLEKVEL